MIPLERCPGPYSPITPEEIKVLGKRVLSVLVWCLESDAVIFSNPSFVMATRGGDGYKRHRETRVWPLTAIAVRLLWEGVRPDPIDDGG